MTASQGINSSTRWSWFLLAATFSCVVEASPSRIALAQSGTSSTQPASAPVSNEAAYTVIDAGAEPRALLRYRPSRGQRYILLFSSESESTREENGEVEKSEDAPLPNIEMRGEVLDVAENGEFMQRVEIVKYEMSNAETRTPVAGVEGSLIELTMDARGRTVRSAIDASKTKNQQLKLAMEQLGGQLGDLSVSFPEEPLGIGARWTVTKDLVLPTMTTKATTAYTLRSIRGSQVVLHVAIDQRGAPRSTKSTVREIVGHTDGDVTFDLSDMAATSSDLKTIMTINQELGTTPPRKIRHVSNLTMKMTTRPLDSAQSRPSTQPDARSR